MSLRPPEPVDSSTRNLQSGTFRRTDVFGKDFLFFGGTAYLGLNAHPDFLELFREGLDRYGLNNGTSRSNNVQLGIYDEAERTLSKQFGFESATLTSSGYLAAQLAVRKLYQDNRTFFAPGSHPALWPGLDAPFGKIDFQNWVTETIQKIEDSPETDQEFLIVGNTIDNTLPNQYDYRPFGSLATKRKIHLLLDDSHGIGILRNREILAKTELDKAFGSVSFRLTIVASLAKGMGIDAGAILSDEATISDLRNSGFFVGASPSAPAFMYALIHGQPLYQSQFEKLHDQVDYFKNKLVKGWQFMEGFPVFCKLNQNIQSELYNKEILISSFPYPSPKDPVLDRIVISAAHTKDDLDLLIQALSEIDAL